MIVGIDFDIVVYRSAFGAQKSVDKVITSELVSHALHNCKSTVERIEEHLQASDIMGYLTASNDPTNYRIYYGKDYGVGPTRPRGYKAHRSTIPKPVHYQACRDYLIDKFPCTLAIGEEADDRMGIDQCNGRIQCIASYDKDLDMIPGKHYNWVKNKSYTISEAQGIANFYRQFLIGDTADNIPGIDGIGPIKSAKLLPVGADELQLFNTIRNIYEDDKKLLDIGRLLWIRRKEGQMWEFPT